MIANFIASIGLSRNHDRQTLAEINPEPEEPETPVVGMQEKTARKYAPTKNLHERGTHASYIKYQYTPHDSDNREHITVAERLQWEEKQKKILKAEKHVTFEETSHGEIILPPNKTTRRTQGVQSGKDQKR